MRRSSLHIQHIYSLRYLCLNLQNAHQIGTNVFLQCGYQLNMCLSVSLHLSLLYPLNLRPLLIVLENLMLLMLGQKLERISIVKNGILLTFLPHPCHEPYFSILQGNDSRSTKNWCPMPPHISSSILSKDVKSSDSLSQ